MPSPDMDQVDRRQNDQSRRPLSVATDNMMLEFYKKDGCVFLLFTNVAFYARVASQFEDYAADTRGVALISEPNLEIT